MDTTNQLGFQFRPPERHVWTVRALVSAVRAHVEREYFPATPDDSGLSHIVTYNLENMVAA